MTRRLNLFFIYLRIVIHTLFVVALLGLALTIISEQLYPGLITDMMPQDYFVYTLIILGVLLLFFSPSKEKALHQRPRWQWVLPLTFGAIIYSMIRDIGFVALLLSGAVMLFLYIIPSFFLEETSSDTK